MILIRKDREIVMIERWEDVLDRPGFEPKLNPNENKLADVLGTYTLGTMVPCGLSTCRQQHAKGYLVVTTSGRETNIGHRCGEAYFGEDFKHAAARLTRDLTEKRNRELVHSFAFQTGVYRERIQTLRTQVRGADWVYHTSRYLIEPGKAPSLLLKHLRNMLRTGDSLIIEQRIATESEADAADARAGRHVPRPVYVDEPIAEIFGLEALRPENDLRELIVLRLSQRIDAFNRLDLDALSFDELKHWAKWVRQIDEVMERAAASIELGRRLLTLANLQPLERLIGRDDLPRFQAMLKML